MGLSKDIVIVNEFTFRTGSKRGTRGATPGQYVLRYMARKGATECDTPVTLNNEDFIVRYMARQSAVNKAITVDDLKKDMADFQGFGGVAFGYGSISLSDSDLKAAAHDIQDQFEKGHTVFKTVISFTEDYLRENGIIQPDFEFISEGDYRGHIDEMKLRFAIAEGLRKVSRHYDDLQYVGVIQVDTKHVHCHIAMVDKGRGTLMPDGTQRGKMSRAAFQDLRRGIDNSLDENKTVNHLVASVDKDKRNAKCFVRKFTHRVMDENSLLQSLIARLKTNLPDKRLWRASTNRLEMKAVNMVVREYVVQLLEMPDSGFDEAIREATSYATHRAAREGLSSAEERKLIDNKKEEIITGCMDVVYDVLKKIPDSEYTVRTPFLHITSMDYKAAAGRTLDASDDIVEFGFKLRTYSNRLSYHRKEHWKYHNAAVAYESRIKAQSAEAQSVPIYDFIKFEDDYHAKLSAKYRHFLDFMPADESLDEEWDKIMRLERKRHAFYRLRQDFSHVNQFGGRKASEEEKRESVRQYILDTYNITDGDRFYKAPDVLDKAIDDIDTEYDLAMSEYKLLLRDYGLEPDMKGGRIKKEFYDFAEIRSLDLHHMSYDYAHDIHIPMSEVKKFMACANERYTKYVAAKAYLQATGQEGALANFDEEDIMAMYSAAKRFASNGTLRSRRSEHEMDYLLSSEDDGYVPPLDYLDREVEVSNAVRDMIRKTLMSTQYEK